jgi:hypothetical protein
MNYATLWLLETAVEAAVPLCSIYGDDRYLTDQWNKPPHHLHLEELASLLCQLIRDKYVECYHFDEYLECSNTDDVKIVPTLREVTDALDCCERQGRYESRSLRYTLTVDGASLWERYAKPAWNRFFSDEWDGPRTVEIIAATSEMLDCILENGPWYWGISFTGGTDCRTLVEPWFATYWKTLPQGHRVRLSYKDTHWKTLPQGRLGKILYADHLPAEVAEAATFRETLSEGEYVARRERAIQELANWHTTSAQFLNSEVT